MGVEIGEEEEKEKRNRISESFEGGEYDEKKDLIRKNIEKVRELIDGE